MLKPYFRFSVFALYLFLLFFFPFSLLFERTGLWIAFGLFLVCLWTLGNRASSRIVERLQAKELTRSEAPLFHHFTHELCRRIGLTPPNLWIIASQVPNLAAFGFSSNRGTLVLTTEVLKLKREEQIALLSRTLIGLEQGHAYTSTWLSQYLSILETFIGKTETGDSLRRLIFQVLLYPSAIVPVFLLGDSGAPSLLDEASIRLGREPLGLTEGYRKIESAMNTRPFTVPLSTYHLFLAEPKRADVVTRVLFSRRSLTGQIKRMNPLISKEAT